MAPKKEVAGMQVVHRPSCTKNRLLRPQWIDSDACTFSRSEVGPTAWNSSRRSSQRGWHRFDLNKVRILIATVDREDESTKLNDVDSLSNPILPPSLPSLISLFSPQDLPCAQDKERSTDQLVQFSRTTGVARITSVLRLHYCFLLVYCS